MKCKSCEEIVASKFAHAIKTNTCPFCGQEIMEPALQSILSNLQALMKEAEPFMAEVEDWLANNYSLRKGNHPSSYLMPEEIMNSEGMSEEDIRRQTEAAKKALDFQKRADIKPVPSKDIKSLVEEIKSGRGGGAAHPSEFVGTDPVYGEVDFSQEVDNTPITQKEANTMIAAMEQGNQVQKNSEDVLADYYEMQKLKRLQRAPLGAKGGFSRG